MSDSNSSGRGNTPRVLFVCVHNSARSQMAEAYLNRLAAGKARAESAGLEPGTLNPIVVEALAEDGIDIAGKETRSVQSLIERGERFDYVIAVCDKEAAERCPIFPAEKERLHWPFADPSALAGDREAKLAQTREIRDEIRSAVERFVAERFGPSG